MRIVMGQINLLVGDVCGNAQRVIDAANRARREFNADLIVFPELALTGYPPEDLLLRPGLYKEIERGLASVQQAAVDIAIVLGYPIQRDENRYNAASVIRKGKIAATYYKQCLPNYAVFDEKRYFTAGKESCVIELDGLMVAITICEDVWEPAPVQDAVRRGAQVVVNLNASPFHIDKWRQRETIVGELAKKNRVPVIYTNLVGGQDELVFDGHSFVVNAQGKVVVRADACREQLVVVDLDDSGVPLEGDIAGEPSKEQSVYEAIVLGVRDYVDKNKFSGVVIGVVLILR